MARRRLVGGGVRVLGRAVIGLGLLGASACAFEEAPGADELAGDVGSGGVSGESLGEGQEALALAGTSGTGLVLPDFPIIDPCIFTVTCCDPAKYRKCHLQSDGPTADVKVKVYDCVASTSTDEINNRACEVEPGWTLIAGGARFRDAYDGVTIWDSHPGGDGSRKWYSSSKLREDYAYPFDGYSLQTYAIGMKLKGYDNVEHHVPVSITTSAGPTDRNDPAVSVKVPNNHLLLSAGFTHAKPGANGLFALIGDCNPRLHELYADRQLNGTVHASSTSVRACQGGLNAIAVSIPRCPPRWNGACFEHKMISETSPIPSTPQALHLNIAFAKIPDGQRWVMTGMGSKSGSKKRYFDEMNALFDVWSDDGAYIGSVGDAQGPLTAQAFLLRK